MFIPTRGPARREVSGREKLDREELDQLQARGTIIFDERRTRPLYFDGRFLAARDLTREQNYFLTRQSDLGRAGGAGIVNGLMVEAHPSINTSIRISSGHGVTPSGELVVLPESLTVELANITESQRLDVAFGLSRIPRESPRNRSGLFIVALRAVEFTANPIASYPTTINGTRSVEDGDIVEGVAITLIPFPDDGSRDQPGLRRARVAHEVFVNSGTRSFPAGALPLAMIALDRGSTQWVDPFMVRREIGAEHGDILNLGFAPRALKEAHLLQYDQHLRSVFVERDKASRGRKFSASEHFLALPPAGRMPAAAINTSDFSQIFFPSEMDVDLSIIPDDEVAALLEESLLLPPIDLTLDGQEQESTSVLVLIPLPRRRIRTLRNTLPTLKRTLLPAAPGLLAKRKPLEVLQGLTMPKLLAPILESETLVDAAWRSALSRIDTLWYVRRRNLNFKAEAAGIDLRMYANEFADEDILQRALKKAGAQTQFTRLKSNASNEAVAEMSYTIARPKFIESRVLLYAVLGELDKSRITMGDEIPDLKGKRLLNRASVMKVSERFNEPRLGEGIIRMQKAGGDFDDQDKVVRTLAATNVIPELDSIVRGLKESEVAGFTQIVLEHAGKGEAAKIRQMVQEITEGKGK